MTQPDGNDDAEGHAAYDEQRIDGPRRACDDIAVEHIIDGVDERDARYDEQCTGDELIPGRRRQCEEVREIGAECCDKGSNGNGCIGVEAMPPTEPVREESQQCTAPRKERGDEVAAKQHTGCAALQSGTQRGDPGGIAERRFFDIIQGGFVFVEAAAKTHAAPGQMAHGIEDGHVDGMMLAFAKTGMGALFVADIQHQRGIHDVQMEFLPRNSHVDRGPRHIAYKAVGMGTVFHEQLSGIKQQMKLAADFCIGFFEFRSCDWSGFGHQHSLPSEFIR